MKRRAVVTIECVFEDFGADSLSDAEYELKRYIRDIVFKDEDLQAAEGFTFLNIEIK